MLFRRHRVRVRATITDEPLGLSAFILAELPFVCQDADQVEKEQSREAQEEE